LSLCPFGFTSPGANNYRNQKQSERELRFTGLSHQYHLRIAAQDRKIIDQPIEELVHDVQDSAVSPLDILRTYGKVAKRAQERTNCVTEVMLPEAESWLESEINLKGPLAGIPVSLKDSINVKGFDTSVGYASLAGNRVLEDGPMVKLLKDAGKISILNTRSFTARLHTNFHRRCPIC
jgi:fatty acid amide hydrolase